MRFIRDIIKEKRGEDAGHRNAPPVPLTASEPLVLDTPAAPPVAAPATADEVQPADALQKGAASRPAPAPSQRREEPAAEKSVVEPAPVPLKEAQPEKLASPAAAPAQDDAAASPDESATDLPGEDPFERLRESGQLPAPARKSVSPMRRAVSAQAQPAAPAKPEQPEAELDKLMPAADAMEEPVQMPGPAKGRGSARSGRVKTRLLGFSAGSLERNDPFEKKPSTPVEFPVGWLVVTSEMGRGASFALHDGVTKVGRGTDQTVSLNFGDNSISRDNHVSIAFDAEQNKFFIGHSGKTNLVRLNNTPLLSTEVLRSKDVIRLGETTLRFIAFCEDDFSWVADEERVARHA